ncbi:MAG TPA: hypothetical protein VN039_12175 [Nitrospira sp.]|nr:hypothetical protein [Nitrospira sp.]
MDGDKLRTLLADANAAHKYATFLDDFIIPLIKKIGLKVSVKKNLKSYVITVRLPNAVQNG